MMLVNKYLVSNSCIVTPPAGNSRLHHVSEAPLVVKKVSQFYTEKVQYNDYGIHSGPPYWLAFLSGLLPYLSACGAVGGLYTSFLVLIGAHL